MGLEPTTSSLGSWHSTTELLPRSCVFRYLTVRQGFSPKRRSKPALTRPCSLASHDNINISQRRAGRFRTASIAAFRERSNSKNASPLFLELLAQRRQTLIQEDRRPGCICACVCAHYRPPRFLIILGDNRSACICLAIIDTRSGRNSHIVF